jgi:dihydroorotase
LSPGWIDLHTHVYKGVCDIGIDPDLIGPAQGVTVLLDAGSSGHITFPGLRDYIITKRDYEIYAYLNYGSAGIIRCNIISDYETGDFIQPEETLACIEQNRNYIKGLKLRASGDVLKDRYGIELVKNAAALAREAKVPLMIHVGTPGPALGDIFNTLDAGDIVTHCFNGKPGGILSSPNGSILKEARAARERGVLFDIGHGAGSFSFIVGQEAVRQGFKPDIVSTDLHGWSYPKPGSSLAGTMSKMICCGLEIEEIIEKVTKRPAEVLKLEKERLTLVPGTKAYFTLFKIEERDVTLFDAMKNPIPTHAQFVPVMTVIGSRKYPAASN